MCGSMADIQSPTVFHRAATISKIRRCTASLPSRHLVLLPRPRPRPPPRSSEYGSEPPLHWVTNSNKDFSHGTGNNRATLLLWQLQQMYQTGAINNQLESCLSKTSGQSNLTKISPVQDWQSTPLEWLSITRDLDLGSGHTAYRRASLIETF